MIRARSAGLSVACAAILTSPAYGQVDVPPDGLTVAPTVRMVYDDNVLRQNDDIMTGDTDDLRITTGVDVTFQELPDQSHGALFRTALVRTLTALSETPAP